MSRRVRVSHLMSVSYRRIVSYICIKRLTNRNFDKIAR